MKWQGLKEVCLNFSGEMDLFLKRLCGELLVINIKNIRFIFYMFMIMTIILTISTNYNIIRVCILKT